MGKINSYKDLIVWQRSIELVEEVYKITRQLPKFELYILASQMIRAAISIPANIAEGFGRNFKGELNRFCGISYGSALELETHLLICQKQYAEIDYKKTFSLLVEVQKMLTSFIIKSKNKT